MEMTGTRYIKVCCISTLDEAQLAVAQGVSAIGLVSAMPSGPGVISDERIAEIARSMGSHVATFLLTSRQTARAIAEQHTLCQTSTIQLVDKLSRHELTELRILLPDVRLVQVIHVTGESSVEEARRVADLVDILLLDSGNPALQVKELGGTGRTHDWSLSRQICRSVSVPVLLAGGLNAANAAQALREVEPFGLDICSGVRSDGHLDVGKLRRFVAAARMPATG
jgi:phosphoribosylanthranilate isomerase